MMHTHDKQKTLFSTTSVVGILVCLSLVFLLAWGSFGFYLQGGFWGRANPHLILSFILPVLIYHALANRFPWATFRTTSRLAFLFTTALTLVPCLYRALIARGGVDLLDLPLSIAGSFGGILLITWKKTGLVEVNSPPSDHIRNAVIEKHSFLLSAFSSNRSLAKRVFDISLSFVGLMLSSPLWLPLLIAIWLEDPGPLLFAKVCVTKGGKAFKQLKFRSMFKGAEKKTGPVLATEADPRRTRVGKLMRKTALDELPQLLNILKGDMSFVGPRPQRTILVQRYLEEMPDYALRHALKAGLTGIAQVYGSYHVTPRQKFRYDLMYIKTRSFWLDLKLIFLSFWITFRGKWESRGKKI